MKPSYTYLATVKRVVDGDTLDLVIDLGFTVQVVVRARLADIDTPETYGVPHASDEYAAGLRAKEYVEQWCSDFDDRVLVKTDKGTGKFGRWLATVYAPNGEGPSLNTQLISEKLATPYYSK